MCKQPQQSTLKNEFMTSIIGGTEGTKKMQRRSSQLSIHYLPVFFFHAFLGTAFMRVAFLTAKDSDLILVVSILVIKKVAKKTLTLT